MTTTPEPKSEKCTCICEVVIDGAPKRMKDGGWDVPVIVDFKQCDWHNGLESENERFRVALAEYRTNDLKQSAQLAAARDLRLEVIKENERLKAEAEFTKEFTGTLQRLGFDERLLDEYREQKMKIRTLSEESEWLKQQIGRLQKMLVKQLTEGD